MFHEEKCANILKKICHFKLKTYKLTGFSTKFPLNSRKILKTQGKYSKLKENTQNSRIKLKTQGKSSVFRHL